MIHGESSEGFGANRIKHLPWRYHLYNLSSDSEESHNLLAELPAVADAMNRSLWAFAASVVRSQGPEENNCAEHFGPPPSMAM